MKRIITILLTVIIAVMVSMPLQAQKKKRDAFKNWSPPENFVIDTRVDNMSYWKRLAELGYIPFSPEYKDLITTYTGSKIYGADNSFRESTDVPTTTANSTQSENSVFVSPLNANIVMNSNNSTPWPVSGIYGANYLYSTNAGLLWGGTTQGAGGPNSGDPTTGIDLNGRYYIGFIDNAYGQSVSWSTNQGTTWTAVVAASKGGSQMLDKNHMWVDVSPTSPYKNNIYDAWCPLSGSHPNLNNIEFNRSTNGGLSYTSPINISSAISAGSHNQGVNITTGPNGEVYAFWAVYDSWPSFEATYGFAKSTNGGATFTSATRFLTGCKGVRDQSSPFLIKNHRTNSFPSATCDISNSSYRGTIYMVWANQGVPGINTGSDIDIYMVKSTNQGTNWSSAIRVTNDPLGNGKKAWFPWISCDPVTGNLSVVFYDDRNTSATQCEAWVANSTNGGTSWDNFKVSDVAFTPAPIPGLAGGYMGDYLGITARAGNVYPCWSDNRSGKQITYVSPYDFAGVTIAVTSGSNPSCSGSSVTFTATPYKGGTTPAYQWKVNGSNVGTNSPTYTTSALTNGQVVTCVMTSNLPGVIGSPATSNPITMVIGTSFTPSVSIAITAGTNPTCSGVPVTFTATPTNGGGSPSYQWKVNGGNVGTNSPTYTSSTLTNGQIVTCVMTSSLTCASPTTATSNAITMTVNTTPPQPTITQNLSLLISSAPAGNQWYLDGYVIPGATNQTYLAVDNGSYTVIVTLNGCSSIPSLPLVINNVGISESDIKPDLNVYPNPSEGLLKVTFNSLIKTTYRIEITDIIGKIVYAEDLVDFYGLYTRDITLTDFGKGVYTLCLIDAKNKTYRKVIIY